MNRVARAAMALVAASVCVAAPARAHLMPKQQATINVRDSAAFGAFSIPVSALRGWDDNRDGRMSTAEFVAHRTTIDAQLDAGIHIASARDAGTRALLLPTVELDEGDSLAVHGGTHLLVLVRQSFAAVPSTIQLGLTLFGEAADEQQFIIKATVPGGAPEVAILTRGAQSHEFFAPLPRVVVAMASLAESRVVGGVLLLTVLGACAKTMSWGRSS